MFSEITNSSRKSGDRKGLYRRGKLVAISAILLSASAGMSFAGQYPVSAGTSQSASVDRLCTQLELSADMTANECGTLTLSEVVLRRNAFAHDGRDE